MKNPLNGSEMTLETQLLKVMYEGKEYEYEVSLWICPKTKDSFSTIELAEKNHRNLINAINNKTLL
jgi:hypothetical protein